VRRLAQALLVFAALLGGPALVALHESSADASVAYESQYTFEQTFGTATRLIRVDMGLKIKEKDAENGFLLFDYTSPESGKKPSPGSIECVRTPRGVHVAVQLPAMPQYHEQVLVDALVRKLVQEHGAPPEKARPPAPKPGPDDADAGADAGDAGEP
jgi:hypothetical protein